MTESMPEEAPRRGRRDPQLESMLEAEVDEYSHESSSDLISEGDRVLCRVTMEHPTAVGSGWFTYGISTEVRPGEEEQDVADRIYAATTERLYGLIEGVTTTVEEAAQEQREQRRSRRNPRAAQRH